MYVQIVRLRVKPDRVAEFLDAFRINYEGTRKEEGNIRFELLRSTTDPTLFTVYEVFASADALAAHRQEEHFKICVGRFAEVLEGERSIEVHSPVMAEYMQGVA